jgi:hypothetical protein
MADVGASLSDVFGADRVLWVEGKTEELCFPLIAQSCGILLRATRIVAVQSTSDHTGGKAEIVFDVYNQLLKVPSLLPPDVAFLFDREGLSDQQREVLTERSKGIMIWLPRRMFENYLIDADAISSVLLMEDSTSNATETDLRDAVRSWLSEHGGDPDYCPEQQKSDGTAPAVGTDAWSVGVHGGKLLCNLVNDLTDTRLAYRKTRHGELLTSALIKANASSVQDLGDVLRASLAPRNDP